MSAREEREKETVTVDEAARRLGLGRNATYEAVRRGEVPAIRIGKRWLVPSVALDRLLLGKAVE
jgi:excisionase family DNA binding protein